MFQLDDDGSLERKIKKSRSEREEEEINEIGVWG